MGIRLRYVSIYNKLGLNVLSRVLDQVGKWSSFRRAFIFLYCPFLQNSWIISVTKRTNFSLSLVHSVLVRWKGFSNLFVWESTSWTDIRKWIKFSEQFHADVRFANVLLVITCDTSVDKINDSPTNSIQHFSLFLGIIVITVLFIHTSCLFTFGTFKCFPLPGQGYMKYR